MNYNNVQNRHNIEKDHFDKIFETEKKLNYYDMGFTNNVSERFREKLGNLNGQKVLEFGCGWGWFTKILAERGAEVWSFDISPEAVEETKALMKKMNLQNRVHVDVMAAEKLEYSPGQFDLVVGTAILHHLDLEQSLIEIRRVLKKGGKAIFMEPLGHNFFLNIYRWITPHKRTKDEMPICFDQFTLFNKYFSKFHHEEYYLISLFALVLYYFGSKKLMIKTRDLLLVLDGLILKKYPVFKKYCWYSIFEFEK